MTNLSIIVPVYQVELYLRECLDSIAVSPLDCWEAILVDDGSPDGCPQICDEYASKDKRFRVIHQENAGVATARNAGLDAAQGEWVWFVDSDDVVDMRPLEGMIEWLKEHLEVDLVMFDLETFKDNEGGLAFTVYRLQGNDTEQSSYDTHRYKNGNINVSVDKNEFLSQYISFFHQQYWFRREIDNTNFNDNVNQKGYENKQRLIHFTKGIRVSEDLERMYKYFMFCRQPVKFEAIIYHYRVRETSVTQDDNYRKKAIEDLPVVLDNLAEWIRNYNVKAEPWLDLRIKMLFQNLLYSASLIKKNKGQSYESENKEFDVKTYQKRVRDIASHYRCLGFIFVNKMKYRLATLSVTSYFLFNNIYLSLRRND